MILDAQLVLSNLASGDSPTLVQDTASSYYIDQQVNGLNFSPPGGGAYVAPWMICQVRTAFTGTGCVIQAVVQDSPDSATTMTQGGSTGTWTDQILGAQFSVGGTPAPSIYSYLLAARLLPTMARYIRVAYRITTAVATAGTVHTFVTLDISVVDIALRQASAYVSQTGQTQEAVTNSILGS